MSTNDNLENLTDLETNEPLKEDLKSLFGTDFTVPRHVDHAIMNGAAGTLKRPKRNYRIFYWGSYAAAASIAIAALFLYLSPDKPQPQLAQAPINQNDVDQNGTVDIRDAFMLARSIKSNQIDTTQWDMNHDGRVDQQDVDAVAMAAVRLNEGVL